MRLETCRCERGFSLVELTLVVVILGIVAAIAIPAFLSQRASAHRSALQSDLRNAMGEMEDEFIARDTYPGDDDATFTFSPGVSLTVVWPPPGGTDYCIRGIHANLPDEPWMVASAEGALRQGACA